MRKITRKKLEKIIKKHHRYLVGANGGKLGVLKDLDLSYMDLSGMNFERMYFINVNFGRSDLTKANFNRTKCSEVSFDHAKLEDASFKYAIMDEVDFYCANLTRACLYKSEILGSDGALLVTDLTGATHLPPMRCPEKGSFTAFKKAYDISSDASYIVELFIPAKARRSTGLSATGRCDIAKVISITTLDGEPTDISTVRSWHDANFLYTVGEYVSVDDFEDGRWWSCVPGIHFFMTRQEAVNFQRPVR